MVMWYTAQSGFKGNTRRGVLLLLFLTVLSVLSVNILGRNISFIFLPLMAVSLWPRVQTPIISIVFILLFGLLLDMLSAGPLGLWSLVFLSVFAILRPHNRLKPLTFLPAFRMWFAVLIFACVAAYFLGWFAMMSQPDIWPLLYDALAGIILFPIVYCIRHMGRNLLIDSDGDL